jgi:hypothetical protein
MAEIGLAAALLDVFGVRFCELPAKGGEPSRGE